MQRLESQSSREELVEHLVALARTDPRLVIGLDFAFAFPEWFARSRGCTSARELWELVASEGESWLEHCSDPFWGRPGRRRPDATPSCSAWRATESAQPPIRGVHPKSTFQIGGAGAVGTGSIRGMPFLATLRRAGFSIWPFDDPRLPIAVEIYPRLLTHAVTKSDRGARELHLRTHAADEDERFVQLAVRSEDAFDALVSARVMSEHRDAFERLEPARDELERLEGRIWVPPSERSRALTALR